MPIIGPGGGGGFQTVTKTLTNAQILANLSPGIVLVPAGAANVVRFPLAVAYSLIAPTGYTGVTGVAGFIAADTSYDNYFTISNFGSVLAGLGAPTFGWFHDSTAFGSQNTSDYAGQGIIAYLDASPTVGGGAAGQTLRFFIQYVEMAT